MVMREQKHGVGSFSRGAELWMHQARLLVVAVWTAIVIAIFTGVAVTGWYFIERSTPVERYALERYVLAELRTALLMTKVPMELYADNQKQLLPVSQVLELTEDGASAALLKLKNGGLFGALSALGLGVLLAALWWNYGMFRMKDSRIRGAHLVRGPELLKMMEARNDTAPYSIAGVPMRKGSETLHTLIGGAQGTGKSQQFIRLMQQVRARGKRAIVYDPSGEFTRMFFREGVDVLMNPLDQRSPNWNMWREIQRDYHFDNMANGLIPDPAEADPFWAQAGRMVLKDVIRVLGQDGRRTNADLYNAIARSNLDEMHTLLAGTAGATYVDPTTERTGMSLKMTIQNQLESFRFLPDTGEPFSIREWVQNDSESWMFITAREELREALKPVLSLWIDTAIKAVLGLEPTHNERLWFFIDELPTLQKLDILKLALTNTRKYGLCMVIGIQDFSQLNEIYGQHQARTIISGCQTKLLLRVTDGEAARLLAKLMGEAELDEKEETLSYGLSSSRDGVSVFARRNLRDIVLTSEVLTLPDMHGYITIPGDYPVARVEYEYEATPIISEGFVERTGFGINFGGGLPLSLMTRGGLSSGDGETAGADHSAGGSGNRPAPSRNLPAVPAEGWPGAGSVVAPAADGNKPRTGKKKAPKATPDRPVEAIEPPLFGEDFPEPDDPPVHFNEIGTVEPDVGISGVPGEHSAPGTGLAPEIVDASHGAGACAAPANTGGGAAGMLSFGKRAE
jgi:type IV conjugative transfer system coupling protein TraD